MLYVVNLLWLLWGIHLINLWYSKCGNLRLKIAMGGMPVAYLLVSLAMWISVLLPTGEGVQGLMKAVHVSYKLPIKLSEI